MKHFCWIRESITILKKTIRTLLPRQLINARQRHRVKIRFAHYNTLSTREIFTQIYKEGDWGKSDDPSDKYYSGFGSRNREVIEAYVESVGLFLRSFETKPNVVDLGCGDFLVGSRLRDLCATYTACDIVEPLVEFNKQRFAYLNVDFRVVDITEDELPQGEIVFIRQVFQHLSNERIQRVLPRLSIEYKYLVLTENLPSAESFLRNLDHPTGPYYRLDINSGIVLTSPPFNLKVIEERTLCQVLGRQGIIQTILYRLS